MLIDINVAGQCLWKYSFLVSVGLELPVSWILPSQLLVLQIEINSNTSCIKASWIWGYLSYDVRKCRKLFGLFDVAECICSQVWRQREVWKRRVGPASWALPGRVSSYLIKFLVNAEYSKAVCDWPASIFGEELIEAYPNAKVILTNRDVDSWYK